LKSTLIKGHELGRYLKIRELVKEYSNDMELGGKVRELFWKSRPHYPSKELKNEWEKNNSI
jgi:hypothetical protein